VLDIGTAKGFSALCLQWALDDGQMKGRVTTLDVLDPFARVRRNTVAELDGLKTLAETMVLWPESRNIETLRATGIAWLTVTRGQIDFAFVDGKHSGDVVEQEGRLIASRQKAGDVTVFDDVHLPDIEEAVSSLSGLYDLEGVRILPHRAYAIGVRRG
jgi:predicted O-methyltransferase YrrM